jgi:enoyl-CoA hydratase
MEFILTGNIASGGEFERLSVITQVFPKEQVLENAIKLASNIASKSGPAVVAAKQAILAGQFNSLISLAIKQPSRSVELQSTKAD